MLSELSFLADIPLYEAEKPYQLFISIPGVEESNVQTEKHSYIEITDVRGHEDAFNLDNPGFQFIRSPSAAAQRLSEFSPKQDELVNAYLADVMAILRRELQTQHIICFDWRV